MRFFAIFWPEILRFFPQSFDHTGGKREEEKEKRPVIWQHQYLLLLLLHSSPLFAVRTGEKRGRGGGIFFLPRARKKKRVEYYSTAELRFTVGDDWQRRLPTVLLCTLRSSGAVRPAVSVAKSLIKRQLWKKNTYQYLAKKKPRSSTVLLPPSSNGCGCCTKEEFSFNPFNPPSLPISGV